ncbi:MAG: hemolysin family protein [Actinomycetota bacterium]
MTTALQLLALAGIVLWNAFFVAAEYAFVAARPTRLRELADRGSRRAERVLRLQENPTTFISAVQVAITMSSLAAGAVGEPVLRRLIAGALDPLGGRAVTAVAVIIGFSAVTAITVVLGEIVPKTLSLARTEPVALWVVRPVTVFARALRPFIWMLERLSGLATRALGLPSPGRLGRGHTEEELKLIVAASFEEGVLEADEQAMLSRVFDFAETEARQVMVPRPDVVALPVDATVAEATALALRNPYTRYPVHGDTLDDIRGVVHVRQLFEAARAGDPQRRITDLVRPVQMVPETKRLDELLREFRRTKSHLAVVVDEYGQLAGVVTLEDLLEEIVGEIADEFDVPNEDVVRIDRRRSLVNASYGLEDFNERFGTAFDTGDFNSIGGVVFDAIGRVPHVGDRTECDGVAFVVREMDGSRVTLLEVIVPEAPPAHREPPAPPPGNGTPAR